MESSSNSERRPFRERIAQHMSRRKNANSAAGPSKAKDSDIDDQSTTDSTFECNVCFDVPRDPVVTPCGHLYCWPCLYRWMSLHADSPQCPVCKAGVDKATVIPIYGRGRSEADDPRQRPLLNDDHVPPRPSGHRAIPLRQRVQANAPFGIHHTLGLNTYTGNYEFSLSNFGIFPNIFGLQVAYPHMNEQPRDEPQENQEEGIPELGMLIQYIFFFRSIQRKAFFCLANDCFRVEFITHVHATVAKIFLLLALIVVIIISVF